MSDDDDGPKRYDILGNPDPDGRYWSEADAANERYERLNIYPEDGRRNEPPAGATDGEYHRASPGYGGGTSSSGCVGLLLVIGLGYWGVNLLRGNPDPEELPYDKLDAEGRKRRDERLKAIMSARALEFGRMRAEREAAMPRPSTPRPAPSAAARTRKQGVPADPPSAPQAAATTRIPAPSSSPPSPRIDPPLPSDPPSSTKQSPDTSPQQPPAAPKRPDPSQMPGLAPSPLMR